MPAGVSDRRRLDSYISSVQFDQPGRSCTFGATPAIISVMPSAPKRTKIRVVLVLAALVGVSFPVRHWARERPAGVVRPLLPLLPASSFLLVSVLLTTDLCVGLVERRAAPDARVVRTAVVLAIGLTVAAVLVFTVLLLWFR